ncbi:GNAT family N-acetyltransferase [Klebsiella sp. Ap-873]|nr:GNAT family N-acetyltransferase [Klebsiella sp. Ap-873]
MKLHSERLCLRPVMESDVQALFQIYGDPATNTYNPAGPFPSMEYAKDVLHNWIEHWNVRGFGNWAISEKDSPKKVIGFGGLTIRSYDNLTMNNLGYRFETDSWGKGLATEFSCFAIQHGFTALHLPEISATVRANHAASQAVLKKSGLKFVREIHDVKNASPSLLFTLLYEEWQMFNTH